MPTARYAPFHERSLRLGRVSGNSSGEGCTNLAKLPLDTCKHENQEAMELLLVPHATLSTIAAAMNYFLDLIRSLSLACTGYLRAGFPAFLVLSSDTTA
jgi:hypothetical protein